MINCLLCGWYNQNYSLLKLDLWKKIFIDYRDLSKFAQVIVLVDSEFLWKIDQFLSGMGWVLVLNHYNFKVEF